MNWRYCVKFSTEISSMIKQAVPRSLKLACTLIAHFIFSMHCFSILHDKGAWWCVRGFSLTGFLFLFETNETGFHCKIEKSTSLPATGGLAGIQGIQDTDTVR